MKITSAVVGYIGMQTYPDETQIENMDEILSIFREDYENFGLYETEDETIAMLQEAGVKRAALFKVTVTVTVEPMET